jgi:hypothetical protein
MAVEQADAFIRTGDTGQPEKQSVDCVLIDASNVDKYTLFAIEGPEGRGREVPPLLPAAPPRPHRPTPRPWCPAERLWHNECIDDRR